MAKQIIVDVRYEHTPAELKTAAILNSGTVEMIKSLISDARQQRFNLKPDPNNYASFIQQEAEIKGAINAYQSLLDFHNDTLASVLNPNNSQEN